MTHTFMSQIPNMQSRDKNNHLLMELMWRLKKIIQQNA